MQASNTEAAKKGKEKNKGTGAGGNKTNVNGKLFEAKTNNCTRLMNLGFVPMKFEGRYPRTQSVRVTTDQWEKTGGKYDFLLRAGDNGRSDVFVLQGGMKRYMRVKYGIQMFRFPDEAYIIETVSGTSTSTSTSTCVDDANNANNTTTTNANTTHVVMKILEKKEQRVQGSVETKLWSGPSLKREYELVLQPEMKPGCTVEVHYGFCISTFLADKLKSDEKKYAILNTILGEHDITVLFGDDPNYFDRLDAWTALECPEV